MLRFFKRITYVFSPLPIPEDWVDQYFQAKKEGNDAEAGRLKNLITDESTPSDYLIEVHTAFRDRRLIQTSDGEKQIENELFVYLENKFEERSEREGCRYFKVYYKGKYC